ncbi:MAG TPA: glycosyltransferase 87 family protein [Terriglobia bacterium]|nr:glycosyltransferase 87 family protein [Terriglobia bacterium]
MLWQMNNIAHSPADPKGPAAGQSGSGAAQSDPARLGTRVFPRAESAVLLLLIGMFLWRGFLPGWRSLKTDFPNYYLAARIYRQGLPLERVYDWTWFARQKDYSGIENPIVGFASLTLLSMLPVEPMASLPPLKAKRLWLIVNLIFLGLAILLLNQMSKLGLRRVMILTFLALDPLSINFLYGQMHVLVLFLLTLAAWAYLRGLPATSGAALAAASALKIYPAFFLFYFIRKKQWRAVFGLVAGCIILAGLSVALFGWPANRTYLFQGLPRAMSGTVLDPYAVRWNSLTALLRRLFIGEPDLNPHPLMHFPPAFAVLQPLCQAILFVSILWLVNSRRTDPARARLEWGSFVALLLVLSTAPGPYHFCVLVLSATLVADYLIRMGKMRVLAAWIALYTLVCLPIYRWMPSAPAGWQSLLSFPRLYAEIALWLFMLWELNRASGTPLTLRLRTGDAAIFGMIFFFLFGAGVASNFRSLRGQFDNYAGRVVSPLGSFMTTEPAVGSGATWFVSMTIAGFELTSLQGTHTRSFSFASDAFHPAWSSGVGQLWVELSGAKSRIVRIGQPDQRDHRALPVTMVEDATMPAVSADGRWLAFIREVKGRGSLWVVNLMERKQQAGPLPAREVAGPSDDVWDVSFGSNDRVLYSAQPLGKLELFSADPASLQVKPISTGSPAPSRFPAVSPDGEWLAYSREEGGAWHLALVDLKTGRDVRLTRGTCNSTHPAWTEDSKSIIYATDCGRGLGLTALARLAVPQR